MPESAGAASRLQDVLAYEQEFWSRGLSRIVGVDEAGRGPLAGPVVAAAVVLEPNRPVPGVTDSKQLTPARREILAREIMKEAAAVGVGGASVREIDTLNILAATTLAMRRALMAVERKLGAPADGVVVDGLPVKGLGRSHDARVKGDSRIHCISCASVVAKVVRDRLMIRLARRYPGFGWDRNKGYGSQEHLDALARLGVTPHHRLTFRGCELELGLSHRSFEL
ncbi:MAG: ribonuclease HII [Gemmatimonadota bacterium]